MPDKPWYALNELEKLDALHHDIESIKQEMVDVQHRLRQIANDIQIVLSMSTPPKGGEQP